MAVPELQRRLAGSPYELIVDDKQKSDPIRFFRGAPASIADLKAGWGVLRPLQMGNRILSFERFAEEVSKSGPGRVFVLWAETGDGKTTFLSQLALHLEPPSIVLRWKNIGEHRPELIRDIERYLSQTGEHEPKVVIVREVKPDDPPQLISFAATNATQNPLPCPLLIAGAPSELAHCHIPGSQRATFGPLPIESTNSLVDQLRKVLSRAEHSGLELEDSLPNLKQFVAEPDVEIFSEPPLVVSLLKATYGTDFRRRLADEYNRLATRDVEAQRIYGYACYFHAVWLTLPLRLLQKWVPVPNLSNIINRFSGGGPWELVADDKGEDALTTRNPVVAQTVLMETDLLRPSSIQQLLDDLFRAAEQTVDDINLVRSLLAGYADWNPAAGTSASELKGRIRKLLREKLSSRSDWTEKSRKTVGESHDWRLGGAGAWASLMHHLLPEALTRDPPIAFLLRENLAWLDVARKTFPPALSVTIEYLEGKTKIVGGGQSVEARHKILESWANLIGSRYLGTDFYFDLARYALEDGEYLLAARAFEYVLALGGRKQRHVQIMYSNMLYQVRKELDDHDVRKVLETGWQTSVSLNAPNAQTGTWFAQELRKTDQKDKAIELLEKILAAVCWGEAILRLAELASNDPRLQEGILDYFKYHELQSAWKSPVNMALAYHAKGLVHGYKRERRDQVECLNKACDHYEEAAAADLRATWPIYGQDEWLQCVSKLRELGAAGAKNRMDAWKSTRDKWDKLKGRERY